MRLRKMEALAELELMESHGITLTRKYTIRDRLCEMQFEIRKQLLMEDERASIANMRGAIVIGAKFAELLNEKFGSPIQLHGWSRDLRKNASCFDSTLSRVHRKYQRRSNTAPEIALAMGLVSSIGLYHLKKSGVELLADHLEGSK